MNKTENMDYIAPILIFHQLNNSETKITCYRQPSLIEIPILAEVYGLNCILTCLDSTSFSELKTLKNISETYNIKWINIEYNERYKQGFINNIKDLYDELINKEYCVLIHCASGVKKISFLVYSLLRMNGESKESATEILLKLRSESRNGVGDYRIEFAERKLIPYLI
jgi:hypothetical protein